MPVRALAVVAAFLAAAPAAGAAAPRLLVDPGRPVVGARTLIELQLRTAARAPLVAELVSPTGIRTRIRLTRVRPRLWRAVVHFPDDGQWLVRVARARAQAKVLVLQNGAALPPFKPNTSKAGALSGLAGPGVVLGR